jgi:hypothetical protein
MDFIERWFNISPDGGNGIVEYILLIILLLLWLHGILAFIRMQGWLRRHRRGRQRRPDGQPATGITPMPAKCDPDRQPIPSRVYRRPDPMIYSQQYLMSRGLPVTWDNPDIHLELDHATVDSNSLAPLTEYDVVAQIWNLSTNAPVVNLPVQFSYIDFGIGGINIPIGQTAVDLPVKGAPGCPAFAHMKWRTPEAVGHYCLQVRLIWADDANPYNNLGQENTNVKPLNSPNAAFTFPVRNGTAATQQLHLEADAYQIPPQDVCPPERLPANRDERYGMRAGRADERLRDDERVRDARLARHRRELYVLPEGWRVAIAPDKFELAPGEERSVTVDITAPDGFSGQQAINVNALEGANLIGGVTLYVHS